LLNFMRIFRQRGENLMPLKLGLESNPGHGRKNRARNSAAFLKNLP